MLVLEYMDLGDLSTVIKYFHDQGKRMPESALASMVAQVPS